MKRSWLKYEGAVRAILLVHFKDREKGLRYWQNKLFISFLLYCLPISLIAVLPGVFMALKDGYNWVAAVDLISLGFIALATFSKKMDLRQRKFCIVAVFYVLAIFLINTLGYVGPGIFYLFAITVLMALLFPLRFAYWSIGFNTLLLLGFVLVIAYKPFDSALTRTYSPGQWIAFSSNLTFLSIIIVLLISRIFDSLQSTINHTESIKERYKNIFYLSPLPMWLFDTETLMFVDVNDAAVRHYGYSKSEFLVMNIKQLRTPEQAAALEELVKQNRVTGIYYDGQTEHIKKNGERITVRIESNLLELGGRKIRLVLATDITEKIKSDRATFEANQKTRRSENNLRAIFESATEGFILIDADCRIKAFNEKATEYIRLNPGKATFKVGENVLDFVESIRVSAFKDIIKRVYEGYPIEYDRWYPAPDGSEFWIHFTVTPVYEDGVITGACITGRDITARKQYIQKIEEQNKVFRRISWMQSHLVRAPLARILGLINLLDHSTEEQERRELIEYLKVSSQELDDIISRITQSSVKSILDQVEES